MLQSANRELSVSELSTALDLHRNSVRFHLEALVDSGFAHRASAGEGQAGRPPLRYSATRQSPTVGTRHLTELVGVLLKTLQHTPDVLRQAEAAGQHWGQSAAAETPQLPSPGLLAAELGQRGFTTRRQRDETGETLCFTRCPFRDQLDADQLPVVCAIHQGFITGFLASQQRVTAEKLEVGTTSCRVRLTQQPKRDTVEDVILTDSHDPTRDTSCDLVEDQAARPYDGGA